MLMNLQQGPLMVRRRGGGAEPAFWVRVVRVAMNTTAGSQDLTDPTLTWTPKAVRAIHIGNDANGVISGSTAVRGAVGAYDGTNQWSDAWLNSVTAGLESQSESGVMIRAFAAGSDRTVTATALIPGGVRVTHANGSNASFITLEMFGGTSCQAKAGVFTPATQNNTVSPSLGFQMAAMFANTNFAAGSSTLPRDAGGFASYQGAAIQQVSADTFFNTPGGTRDSQGYVRDNGLLCSIGGQYLNLTAVSSTAVTIQSLGMDWSPYPVGYLALGGCQGYAAVYDAPTSTGLRDYGGAMFTPVFAALRTSRITAINTNQTSGEGTAWSHSSITAAAQYCNHWRSSDNSGSGGSVNDFAEASSVALNTSDHRSLNDHDAAFSGFASTKMTLNETAVTGTATKRIALLLG